MRLIKAICADESGAAAIEYGLLVALIAVGAVSGFGTLGTKLNALFSDIASVLR